MCRSCGVLTASLPPPAILAYEQNLFPTIEERKEDASFEWNALVRLLGANSAALSACQLLLGPQSAAVEKPPTRTVSSSTSSTAVAAPAALKSTTNRIVDFSSVASDHPLKKVVHPEAPTKYALLSTRAIAASTAVAGGGVSSSRPVTPGGDSSNTGSGRGGSSRGRFYHLYEIDSINHLSRETILNALKSHSAFHSLRELQALVTSFLTVCSEQLSTAELRQLYYVLTAVPKHHINNWVSGSADLPTRSLAPTACFEEEPSHSITAEEVLTRDILLRPRQADPTRQQRPNGEAPSPAAGEIGVAPSPVAPPAPLDGLWTNNFVAGNLLLSFVNLSHPKLPGFCNENEARLLAEKIAVSRSARNPKGKKRSEDKSRAMIPTKKNRALRRSHSHA